MRKRSRVRESQPTKIISVLTAFLAAVFVGIASWGINTVSGLTGVVDAKFFGIETTAIVIDKSWIPSEGRRVEYEFRSHDGDSYRRRVPVQGGMYDAIEIGSHVMIRYSVDDPSESVLDEGDLLLLGALFHVVIVTGIVWMIGYSLRIATRSGRPRKS